MRLRLIRWLLPHLAVLHERLEELEWRLTPRPEPHTLSTEFQRMWAAEVIRQFQKSTFLAGRR